MVIIIQENEGWNDPPSLNEIRPNLVKPNSGEIIFS